MIGRTLSHYQVLSKLGEGGMGEVYLARDSDLDRNVALKLLPEDVADDSERLTRFEREAKAVAALNHPNIVTIHSIEKSEGTRFLTMEHVDGDSLDKVIPGGGLSLAKLFEISVPLADALAAAHAKGIVHRDLKPANIMLTRDGRVKVLDFGLAKLTEEAPDSPLEETQAATRAAALTGIGTVMGTAPYMSPEQLEGRAADHRTDIFSLGIVLYEMATGERPFQGETSASLVSKILRDAPTPVSKLNSSLPRHLGRIIEHCLEKDPNDRYQSALDVRNELRSLRREVESGSLSQAPGTPDRSSVEKRSPEGRRFPSWLWAAGGVVLLMVGGWWLASERSPVDPAAFESEDPVSVEKQTPSVAVLPFSNLSADPENEYFTDGLTEELIQALARVEGLRIPARTSVFALKETSLTVQEIGDRLGVGNVLEGSVRREGNQLRISAQLINVADGFNLWSDTYDRELKDVFAIQGEIARNIADALELTLAPGQEVALQAERPTDIQAYDFYLRGRGYFRRRTLEDFQSARLMFQRAIEIDPEYAPAYAGLADSYTEFYRNYDSSEENLAQAEQASQKAVDLDPELAEAHSARGYALGQMQRYEEAEGEFERAIELNPEHFEAYYYYGTVAFAQGELVRSAAMFEKANAVAPDDERALRLLPQVYRSLGREAEERSANERRLVLGQRRLEINPEDIQTLLDGAQALAALGDKERSLEWAARVLDTNTNDALMLYNIACFYSMAEETDEALDSLERSYSAGLADPDWMQQDSDLDNIRDDPRYEALIQRMLAEG